MAEQQSSGMQTAEEMAADRYRVKRTGLGWWRVSVGDGQQTVCFTRAEAERLASGLRAAFLDGAHVVAELNEHQRAMRELGRLVRGQSRSRGTPVRRPVGRLPSECTNADAPICPWCDRQGWDTCQHYNDTRTCTQVRSAR